MRPLFTRVATGAAAAALSVGFLVGTTAPASAAGCRTSFTTYSTVKAGSKGTKARAVECLLHEAGYTATRNGSFSHPDARKLAKFQVAHSLEATGRTDQATWAALIARGTTPALAPGDENSSVRRLQLALRALGHSELPGTTLYGSLTTAAVEALQTSAGLPATGLTGDAEWALLQGVSPAPSGSSGGGSTTPVKHTKKHTKKHTSKGKKALAFAKKQLGDRYSYGAAGPNRWDCSGLTMKAWAKAGVKLPHSAKAQYRKGKKVKKSQLRPGDLVFFYSGPSHVAIYAGHGKVIHAPRPGQKVSYIKMKYMPFKGARRPG